MPDVRTLFKELGDAQLQRVRRLDDLVKKLKREKDEPEPSKRRASEDGQRKNDEDDEEEREEPGEETPVGQ